MRAIVYNGPGKVDLQTMPVPACGDDEIRVRVDACAVCGTDLKTWTHGNPRIEAPRIMGHEFTGLIETLGADVTGFAADERIVMATSVSCGDCFYCGRGWRNLCANLSPMGFGYEGGMAEYVTIPARAIQNSHVVKVPDGVAAKYAALAEPVSCAVNSLENCNIEAGDTVVVAGAGPMGILNACVARESGAGKIILSEINEARLNQAGEFGIDRLVNPSEEDLVAVVHEETGGVGADIAIVAVPAAFPQEQALQYLRKRGTLCLFASLPVGSNMLSLDSRLIHYGEIRVVGTSDSTAAHVRRAVDLIGGGLMPVGKLVTHVLDLAEIEEAFELMKSGESLRVVLTP